MQRLFSMFPTARPGVALLLLRVALAIMLVQTTTSQLLAWGGELAALAPTAVGMALCVGFLTPGAAALCVALEVVSSLTGTRSFEAWHLCVILDAVALGLLGPGGYSIDGRLFGRRLVVLDPEGDDGKHRG